MVGSGRVEMSSCGLEVWSHAAWNLMEVNGVLTRRESGNHEMNLNAVLCFLDCRSTDLRSLGIIECDNLGELCVIGKGSCA